MEGLSETGAINAFTAFISAAALILVALIGKWQLNGRREAREAQEELAEAVKPTNGHDTLGQGIQAIEEHLERIDVRLQEGEERFGRIEVDLVARAPRIARLEDKAAETLNLVADNHEMFKNYIEAWTPLAARAIGEWGVDGLKDKMVTVEVEPKKKGRK